MSMGSATTVHSSMMQGAPMRAARPVRRGVFATAVLRPTAPSQQQQQLDGASAHQAGSSSSSSSRRSLLAAFAAGAPLLLLQPQAAVANPIQDLARQWLRPDDIQPKDAVVVLLDAKSTLKEIQALAATGRDSEERFRARSLWPGLAKRLRDVADAAPVVAGLVSGTDKEATLSAAYGGKAAAGGGVTDGVYVGLGRVLTLSGRTINGEAQYSPEPAQLAEVALDEFLAKVPRDLLASAQAFRQERAKQQA